MSATLPAGVPSYVAIQAYYNHNFITKEVELELAALVHVLQTKHAMTCKSLVALSAHACRVAGVRTIRAYYSRVNVTASLLNYFHALTRLQFGLFLVRSGDRRLQLTSFLRTLSKKNAA